MSISSEVSAAAFEAFAEIDEEDPREATPGCSVSTRYHSSVARWVDVLDPGAPDVVRLAARCQHIRRWTIPRTEFETGRTGYKRWRSALSMLHADEARAVLERVGAPPDAVERVRALLTKKRLRSDAEVQLLEDAVCLAFLELEFEAFSTKHPEPKMVEIVQKTWAKMSPSGHAAALELAPKLGAGAAGLLQRALAG